MERREGDEWGTIRVLGRGQWDEPNASHHVAIFAELGCTSKIENDTLSGSSINSNSEEGACRDTETTNDEQSAPSDYANALYRRQGRGIAKTAFCRAFDSQSGQPRSVPRQSVKAQILLQVGLEFTITYILQNLVFGFLHNWWCVPWNIASVLTSSLYIWTSSLCRL